MRKLVLFIFILLLVACEPVPTKTKTVNVNDKEVDIYLRSFTIVCDTDKKMGIAFTAAYMSNKDGDNMSESSVGGMLTQEQYEKWCE